MQNNEQKILGDLIIIFSQFLTNKLQYAESGDQETMIFNF